MPVSLRSGSSKETGIRQMTINQRASLKSKIRLAPYNPDWPMQYAELAGRIRAALGKKALLLEHVGSTSVPGLCAKPVIDIVLAVADSADEPSYIPPLEACGFALRFREPDWYQHACSSRTTFRPISMCSARGVRKPTACFPSGTVCAGMRMNASYMKSPNGNLQRRPGNTRRIMQMLKLRSSGRSSPGLWNHNLRFHG